MPARASASSAAVTSGRTSLRAKASSRRSVRPRDRMSPNRSSSAACKVRSAAISPTSPGSAARAAGVVSTRNRAAHHLAHIAGQRSGVGQLGAAVDREHRLVHEVRLARPAPVDRGLTRARPPGDRVHREPGIPGLAEQVDGRAEHRPVDAWIARSAKVCCHYETQSNISRHDRRHNGPRPPRRPRRAPLSPRGRADPRHDGRAGAPTARSTRMRCTPERLRIPASTTSGPTTTGNDSTSISRRCTTSTACTGRAS